MMPPIDLASILIFGLGARKTHLYRTVLLQRRRPRQV
jgi:hypothetical protein